MFASLGFQLSTARTPLEAANMIIKAADDMMGWDSCSVYLIHPETGLGEDVIHMDIVDGTRRHLSENDGTGILGEIAKKTIKDGAQLLLRDSAESTHGLRTFGDRGRFSLSLMFVPIRSGGGISGVMSIQSYSRNAYNRKDLEMLQGLADHCAGAFDRTRVDEIFKQGTAPAKKPSARKSKPKGESGKTAGRKRA
jgi:hypothetical protein